MYMVLCSSEFKAASPPFAPISLADHCLAYALKHFDLASCCPALLVGDMLSLSSIRQAALHYIQDNFDRVCQVLSPFSLISLSLSSDPHHASRPRHS